MSRLAASSTTIAGLMRIERVVLADDRGSLTRLFCDEELALAGWRAPVRQVNQTITRHAGTVRGMHFQQPPHGEHKLVTCLTGEVFDVAVDLRRGSPTFLHWHAERLSGENLRSLLIPPGFAHGFQTLCDNVQMLYLHSSAYAPGAEGGLQPADPALTIDWPLPICGLSARDEAHAAITAQFQGIDP